MKTKVRVSKRGLMGFATRIERPKKGAMSFSRKEKFKKGFDK
jgi:stalled ribosome alternative rescue factor ArfA